MRETVQPPQRRDTREERLTLLMEAYANEVLRLCYFQLRDRAQAEDAMQETFLKAYRRLDTVRGSEKAWLMKIALNCCRDVQRGAWFRHVDSRRALEDLPPAACAFDERDDSLVREVLALPSKYRQAILMRYYHEMTQRECASALGLSESGFSRRIAKAQKLLKTELERWDWNA